MAPGVAKTYIKELHKVLNIRYPEFDFGEQMQHNGKLTNQGVKQMLKEYRSENRLIMDNLDYVRDVLRSNYIGELSDEDIEKVLKTTYNLTEDATHQAMEAVIHNLNSMHSRAGRI